MSNHERGIISRVFKRVVSGRPENQKPPETTDETKGTTPVNPDEYDDVMLGYRVSRDTEVRPLTRLPGRTKDEIEMAEAFDRREGIAS